MNLGPSNSNMKVTYRAIPASNVGAVVVIRCVGVEELPRIVGVVAFGLQPDGQVVLVEALPNELWISTCKFASV